MSLVIQLCPFTLADIPAFTAAINASLDTLRPWMVWAYPDYQPEEAASWITFTLQQRIKGEAEECAIVDASDRLLDGAGIRFAREPDQLAALGYWVRSDMQRQGVASRAVALLLERGFARREIKVIEILAAKENHASRAVAERCGAHLVAMN